MIRRLLIVASALSLVFCATTVAIWVRSYWAADFVLRWKYDPHALSITSNSVTIGVGKVNVLFHKTKFDTVQAYKRHAGEDELKFYFSESPPQYGSTSLLKRFALRINSVRFNVDEYGGSKRVRVNGVWKNQRLSAGKSSVHNVIVFIPIWYFTLLSFILGLPSLHRVRRRLAGVRPGHCSECGYDLRASQDRCPECGTPIPSKATE